MTFACIKPVVFASLMAASSLAMAAVTQADVDRFADQARLTVDIVDNTNEHCPDGTNKCFQAVVELTTPADLSGDLRAPGPAIYFSLVQPLLQADSDMFAVKRVNGDLHVMTLKPGMHLKPSTTYSIRLWGMGHFFSVYYVMPNFYAVAGGLAARTIRATRPQVDAETGLETLPFVKSMTNEAQLATNAPDDQTRWLTPARAFDQYSARHATTATAALTNAIIPTPRQVVVSPGPALDITGGVTLNLSGVGDAAIAPALAALHDAGVGARDGGPVLSVTVTPRSPGGAEGYRLSITGGTAGMISINAATPAGASNALRSLAQQVVFDKGQLTAMTIDDAPRFAFRGMHIDIARNFHSKAEILKIIEEMARVKLNRLHLHLADDEGWRLQIASLPELTDVGSIRCHDLTETHCLLAQLGAGPDGTGPVNGFLTQADYRDILLAAKARYIEVIPSFDMPGHSRAAIRSMEARYRRLMALGQPAAAQEFRLAEPEDNTLYRSVQNYEDNTLNVCREATYRFLDKVIDEVARLHAEAGVPLKDYHIGADETAGAWSGSPACQTLMKARGIERKDLASLFLARVSQSLAKRGIEAGAWSDGLSRADAAALPKAIQSNIWSDLFTGAISETHDHANRGWRTIISIPNVTYFDIPQAIDPMERGYDWPARSTDAYTVFAFMPENLPANMSVMPNIFGLPTTVQDETPLLPGSKIGGIQGQLFSETIRSDAQVDYMVFPRLWALAERAWHTASWEVPYRAGTGYRLGDGQVSTALIARDWQGFADRVSVQLPMLDKAGVAYRLAPPGARIVGGKLEAIAEFGATPIEYRQHGAQWQRYSAPAVVSGDVEVRTRSPDGRRASRTVIVRPAA